MIEYAVRSKYTMTYEDAVMYCFFLEHDGHRDWRLPVFAEYNPRPLLFHSCWYQGEGKLTVDSTQWYVQPVRTSSTLHSNKYMHTVEEP